MLRVRPIIFTSAFEDTLTLLRTLGLDCVENDGDWAEFESGNGKIGVFREAPELNHIELAFELRDAAIFVQRTLADGTAAELADTITGPGAQVTAPDGFSFELTASDDLSLPRPAESQTTGSRLTVVQTWCTPRPAEANAVLANIGAKPLRELPGGGALFRAKNGGLVATARGEGSGVVLGFMYDGELSALAVRLAAAGVSVAVDGDVLEVNTPDGGRLSVATGWES